MNSLPMWRCDFVAAESGAARRVTWEVWRSYFARRCCVILTTTCEGKNEEIKFDNLTFILYLSQRSIKPRTIMHRVGRLEIKISYLVNTLFSSFQLLKRGARCVGAKRWQARHLNLISSNSSEALTLQRHERRKWSINKVGNFNF